MTIDKDYIDVDTKRAEGCYVEGSEYADALEEEASTEESGKSKTVGVETHPADDVFVPEQKTNDDRPEMVFDDAHLSMNGEEVAEVYDFSFELSKSYGDGANDMTAPLIDQTSVIGNDGRSQTRTYFIPTENIGERDVQRWKKLARWQDGEQSKERAQQNNKAWKSRIISTFGSHLELTSLQQDRVTAIVESVNLSHMAHFSMEDVIMAAITFAAGFDGRFIRQEPTYEELLQKNDMTTKDLRTCRKLLREKSAVIDAYRAKRH